MTNRAGAPLRGCLLDVDGTLIDSNDAHARSWVEAFAEFDFDIPFSRVRPLIGKGGDKLVRELVDLDVERGRGKELAARRGEIFVERYLHGITAFDGAHELIESLRARGLTLVIATSAQAEELEGLLEQAGLDELIPKRTTSDDASRSKPDPDIVKAALARGHLRSDEVLMLGDTPYDVQAARRAGIGTIALRCGGWWSDDALGDALAIYDDPAALLREMSSSPLG